MRQTDKNTRHSLSRLLTATPMLIASSCLLIVASVAPIVRADSIQNQINSLNSQNAQTQSTLNSLQLQANSYQDAINQLQTQISAIETAISAGKDQQAQLQQQIQQDQAQIAQQKVVLGDDIKAMYVDGQMTTIEELATSKNLSDFVDAETYRNAVQNKIQTTLTQIAQLEDQQEAQQQQINSLLQSQQSQQTQLDNDQQQQAQLLSYNQSQQSQYNQQIQANNSQIAQLKAEQAAQNAAIATSVRISGPASDGSGGLCDNGSGNGGYPMPLCNTTQDAVTDSAGFPNRECTSFANWYFVNEEGQSGFSVSGNAGWWYLTSSYGSTTWSPGGVKVGAIGVEPSSSLNAPVATLHTSIDGGYYGHVMIVLALPGTTYDGSLPYTSAVKGTNVPSGDVLVMSMNEDGAGHFAYDLWPVDYLMYINPH